MFSYKTAVAVKKLGYKNIKIYNGGIKDWKKSGLHVESINPLPEGKASFVSGDELKHILDAANERECLDTMDAPIITLLDFRNEIHLQPDRLPVMIKTNCQTITLQLDDLLNPDVRKSIPKKGKIVTISETGNRDVFVKRYLTQFGFDNVSGLQFGMRTWIKSGYPTR